MTAGLKRLQPRSRNGSETLYNWNVLGLSWETLDVRSPYSDAALSDLEIASFLEETVVRCSAKGWGVTQGVPAAGGGEGEAGSGEEALTDPVWGTDTSIARDTDSRHQRPNRAKEKMR